MAKVPDVWGTLELRGCLKSAPENYKEIVNKNVILSVFYTNQKKNDYITISCDDNIITVPRFLWHETNNGRITICTASGLFKINI